MSTALTLILACLAVSVPGVATLWRCRAHPGAWSFAETGADELTQTYENLHLTNDRTYLDVLAWRRGWFREPTDRPSRTLLGSKAESPDCGPNAKQKIES